MAPGPTNDAMSDNRSGDTNFMVLSSAMAIVRAIRNDMSTAQPLVTLGEVSSILRDKIPRLFEHIRLLDVCILLALSFLGLQAINWVRSYLRSRRYHDWALSQGCEPCGALPRPVLGYIRHKLLLVRVKGADLLDHVFHEKFVKFGTTYALHDSFGVPKVVHTIDPVNVNSILVSSWLSWRPSDSRRKTLYPLAQEGLLLTDGQVWQHNRKLIQRFIGANNAKDVKVAEKDIQLLFEAIGPVDQSGWTEEVDLLELFHRMALDMSTTFLLGTSANSQANGIFEKAKQEAKVKYGLLDARNRKKAYTYDEAYEIIRNYISLRAKLGSKYWLADGPTYRKACATITDFCHQIILRAIEDAKSSSEVKGSFGLISKLMTEIGDPVEIRNLIMDMFIAGQNMTGTMSAWLFARLDANPDMFQAVRQEVLEVFGTERSPLAPMTWHNLRSCNLLQCCILETLRVTPVIANIGRNARHDIVLPRGGGPDGTLPVAVPAGAAVMCNIYLMQRREEEWGADAWEWKPRRWEGRKFGPEFAPFGGGPRICIGQQLSMTEISLVTARMLQRFSGMQAAPGRNNLIKDYRIAIAPKGVKVKLQLAKDE